MTLNQLINRLVLKRDNDPKFGETEVTARLYNGLLHVKFLGLRNFFRLPIEEVIYFH